MTLQQLYLVLLVGGLVLLASIVGTRVASRVGLPSLLLFLGVGVIIGEDGLGLQFDNVVLAGNLGTAALAVILVEGGLTTRFADIRKVLAPAVRWPPSAWSSAWRSPPRARICCSAWTGSWRCCSAPSCRPPTPRRCSRCCACCRCPGAWPACWRPSPDSTTRPPSSSC